MDTQACFAQCANASVPRAPGQLSHFPSPAMSSLLAMCSRLLSLSLLDFSSCLWIFSLSHQQSNPPTPQNSHAGSFFTFLKAAFLPLLGKPFISFFYSLTVSHVYILNFGHFHPLPSLAPSPYLHPLPSLAPSPYRNLLPHKPSPTLTSVPVTPVAGVTGDFFIGTWAAY